MCVYELAVQLQAGGSLLCSIRTLVMFLISGSQTNSTLPISRTVALLRQLS